MAPKTLSTFVCPLSIKHNPITSYPTLLNLQTKPRVVVCGIFQSQQVQKKTPPLSSDALSPDTTKGTGAAAPTPGDRFLERHRSNEAAKLLLKEKKKQHKEKPLKVSINMAACYGCGAPLQTSEVDAPGYVDTETYELKKKHHQLRSVLCRRCKLLSHGQMITAVGGNGGYSGGKQFITAEQLREKLSHLRYEKALIVKLVDIVDFNGSFLAHVRDLVGANPIILVVTKVDLLPKGTDLNCVGDWVVEATTKKKLNVLSIHLTSSKSLVGISRVASEIQQEKKGRDTYILGSANVGKSAFITALLKLMGQKDPVAAAAQKYKPIQSAVPGTTLGPIQINAFLGGGKLYDTPGIHLHHRLAAVVHSEDLPALAPQSQFRGQSFPNSQISSANDTAGKDLSNDLNGYTLFWGGLVRIDVLKCLPETRLTFYGPKSIQIHMVPTDTADEFYQKEHGLLLTPPKKQREDEWRGLEKVHHLQIKSEDTERPACDIAVSGLGWITVEPMSKLSNLGESTQELKLAVHVPKSVEIFSRSPMPVSKAGAGWYQYRELTDEEEEVRPKWYF